MKPVILILIAGVCLWYVFIIIYHFIRFGIGTKPKTLSLIFLAGSIIAFISLVWTYNQVDWDGILKIILDKIKIYL